MPKAALTTRHYSLTAISMLLEDDICLCLICLFEDENKNCVKWCYPPRFAKNLTLGEHQVLLYVLSAEYLRHLLEGQSQMPSQLNF